MIAPRTLVHKHGGRITAVRGVGHELGRLRSEGRSGDTWFLVCDVEWADGSASHAINVQPFLIGGGDDEFKAAMTLMNAHLEKLGEWRGSKGWFAHRSRTKRPNTEAKGGGQ